MKEFLKKAGIPGLAQSEIDNWLIPAVNNKLSEHPTENAENQAEQIEQRSANRPRLSPSKRPAPVQDEQPPAKRARPAPVRINQQKRVVQNTPTN